MSLIKRSAKFDEFVYHALDSPLNLPFAGETLEYANPPLSFPCLKLFLIPLDDPAREMSNFGAATIIDGAQEGIGDTEGESASRMSIVTTSRESGEEEYSMRTIRESRFQLSNVLMAAFVSFAANGISKELVLIVA